MSEDTDASKHQSIFPLTCKICGDVARGLNFNVITCMSCKVFFRRNAYRQESIQKCRFTRHCEIVRKTRSFCSACRLEKCFQVGMDRLLIRRVQTYSKKSKDDLETRTVQNKSYELVKPRTLALLQRERSLLTNDQWTLISNIIHLYDDLHPIEQIRQSIEQMAYLPAKLRLKPVGIALIVNRFYANIQPFIQRCPDFIGLPSSVGQALIRRNISLVGGCNTLLLCRELALSEFSFIKSASFLLYGDEVIFRSLQQVDQVDSNGNLVKILMMILFFSSNTSAIKFDPAYISQSFSSSTAGIGIQDLYVTIFWKYLLYLYGFDHAVLRFSSLIKRIVDLIYTAGLLSEHPIHNQMLQSIASSVNESLTPID